MFDLVQQKTVSASEWDTLMWLLRSAFDRASHTAEVHRNGRCVEVLDDAFVKLLCRHRVAGLAYHATGDNVGSLLRKDSPCLQEAVKMNVQRNLHALAELQEIDKHMKSASIPFLVYKGPVLSQWYGGMSRRDFCDLDIMVESAVQAERAVAVLRNAGYRTTHSFTPEQIRHHLLTQCEFQLLSPRHRMLVELHWRPFYTYLQLGFPIDAAWKRLINVSLGGRSHATFSSDDTFLIIACHAARHGWEHLQMVCDLMAVIRQFPELDWERLLATTYQTGARGMLLLAFRLLADVFHWLPPSRIREEIEGTRHLKGLYASIRKRLTCREASCLAPWSSALQFAKSLDGQATRFRFLLQACLTPTEKDFQYMTLPSWAFSLYPALRLLRHLEPRN